MFLKAACLRTGCFFYVGTRLLSYIKQTHLKQQMTVIEEAKKNKLWIFISAASLLVIIILSYLLLSIPDRTKDIESLKQDKAQLEGQILQIKNNNFLLEEANKKLELKADSLMSAMTVTQKKIDKLNYDLKQALARINQYTDTELVDFFTEHFNGK